MPHQLRSLLIAAAALPASAQQAGDLLWRYEIQSDYLTNHPSVAPDGTIYVSDLSGQLYAITPDGQERWTRDALLGQQGSTDEGPVAIFADGTVLVATNPLGDPVELVAFAPDGDFLWKRTFSGLISWFAGPNIGPDGRAYLAASGPNADSQVFAIDAKGELGWEMQTDPPLFEENPIGSDICFIHDDGDDLLLFHSDQNTRGELFILETGTGQQRLSTPVSSVNAPFMQHLQLQVATDPVRGRAYMTAFGWGSAAWGMRAFEPDGSVAWTYDPRIASEATAPAVGPDGTIFVGWDLQYFAAVETDGSERWQIFDDIPIRKQPAVSPNGDKVVVVGSPFGVSGRVEAYDTATGNTLWETPLTLPVPGTVYGGTRPTFAPSGEAVYFGSSVFAGPDVGSYVYAYAATDAGCRADINGDGSLDGSDFSAWINAFNNDLPECDQNDDGDCTPADFTAWINNYNAGC